MIPQSTGELWLKSSSALIWNVWSFSAAKKLIMDLSVMNKLQMILTKRKILKKKKLNTYFFKKQKWGRRERKKRNNNVWIFEILEFIRLWTQVVTFLIILDIFRITFFRKFLRLLLIKWSSVINLMIKFIYDHYLNDWWSFKSNYSIRNVFKKKIVLKFATKNYSSATKLLVAKIYLLLKIVVTP